MKHVRKAVCLIALAAMLLQCGAPAFAAGSPLLPAIYWGSVTTVAGSPVASGEVEAIVDGNTCGSIEITGGTYGNPPPGRGLVVQGEGGDDLTGKTVRFRVNGVFAGQTVTWASEDAREINLTVDLPEEPANPPGDLLLQRATLPVGTVGQSYNYTLTAAGGKTPYHFSLESGQLPIGLTLSAAGGLSGTPGAAGTYNFTVAVTDADNNRATRGFTLTINQASTGDTVTPSPSPVAGGGGGGGPITNKTTINTINDGAVREAIARAEQTGKVTIQAASGEQQLALTLTQLTKIQNTGKPVEIIVGSVSMVLPPQALQVAELNLPETARVQLAAAPVAREQVEDIIARADKGGIFGIAGDVFEISASAVLDDGTQKHITQFNGKIQVTLPVPANAGELAARGKITAGYYDEQRETWRDMGGKYNPATNSITFETDHFSKYAVMEKKTPEAVVFNDIAGHWAEKDIEFMAARGLAGGVGNGMFAPEAEITRSQFAAFLVRILGIPESTGNLNFSDVHAGDWYYSSLAAAYASGLIKGVGEDKIAPNDHITREQMAVMIVRAMEYTGKVIPAAGKLTFTDQDVVSDWAKSGVSQSARLNLISGFPDGTFGPRVNATRAQAIVILHRVYNQIQ